MASGLGRLILAYTLINVNGVRAVLPRGYLKLLEFYMKVGTLAASPNIGSDPGEDVALGVLPHGTAISHAHQAKMVEEGGVFVSAHEELKAGLEGHFKNLEQY